MTRDLTVTNRPSPEVGRGPLPKNSALLLVHWRPVAFAEPGSFRPGKRSEKEEIDNRPPGASRMLQAAPMHLRCDAIEGLRDRWLSCEGSRPGCA